MDRTTAPPTFSVSRKRKAFHLLEEKSPEPEYHYPQHPQSASRPPPYPVDSSSPRSRASSLEERYRDRERHSLEYSNSDQPNASTSATVSGSVPIMSNSQNQEPSDPNRSVSTGPQLELPAGGLNRGFACLGCRKRKSKCVLSHSIGNISIL
jgi:hypothetical protein